MSRGVAPKIPVPFTNDSGLPIPPFSIVQATSVTTSADGQETRTVCDQYDGSAGNVMVTGAVETPAYLYEGVSQVSGRGTAYYDQFLYVAIDPDATEPVSGDEWGPVNGEWFIGPTGFGFVCQGFSLDDSLPKRALFYRVPASTLVTSEHGGCNCCDGLECITDEEVTVSTCTECPNGAAYRYQIEFGQWVGSVGFREIFVTYTGSGCTWESANFSIGLGTYKVRLTMDGNDTVAEVVYVSGTDGIDLPNHPIKYKAVGNYSCRCESRLEAFEPENFPQPTTGLNSAVCVTPISGFCSCCIVLSICGLEDCGGAVGGDFTANADYPLNGEYNCAAPSESGNDFCYFNPFNSDCCDESGRACWYARYTRATRLMEVFHPGFTNINGDPVYTGTLPTDASPCDGESYELDWNYSSYPSGPSTFDAICPDGLPESVSFRSLACGYGYGLGECLGDCAGAGSTDYEAIEDVGSPTGFIWGATSTDCSAGCTSMSGAMLYDNYGYPEDGAATLEGVPCVPI